MNLPRTMTDLATGTWMLSGDQVVRNEVIIKRRSVKLNHRDSNNREAAKLEFKTKELHRSSSIATPIWWI